MCNTEYQDELINVISECTCTVRQRDRFKHHVLPSYDMSLAQNLNINVAWSATIDYDGNYFPSSDIQPYHYMYIYI